MECDTIIVQKAINLDTNLNHIDLAKLAGFNDKEIEMVTIFWDAAFNKNWIYMTSEIIHDYFGYKKSDSSSKNFYVKLKNTYNINIDYQEVTKDHKLVKSYQQKNTDEIIIGNRTKYYIITGQTFKKIAMRVNTSKGDEICNYFIKVESLCLLLMKYTAEKLKVENFNTLKKKDLLLQIKEDENKWLHIKSKQRASYKLYENPTKGLYLGALISDAKDYIYKIGKSIDVNARQSSLSVSTTDLNSFKMNKVYTTYTELQIHIESFIQNLLKPFCINESRKEHFVINANFADQFIQRILSDVNIYTNDINEYIQLLNDNKFNYDTVNEILNNKYNITITNTIDNIIEDITPVIKIPVVERKSTKKCQTCKLELIKSDFNLSPTSGLIKTHCKNCINKYEEYISTNKCQKCFVNKKKSEFELSEISNKLYPHCKDCREKNKIRLSTKKCQKCLVLQDKINFILLDNKQVDRYCIICRNTSNILVAKTTLKCFKCLVDKERDEFNISKTNNKIKTYCKDCNLKWKSEHTTLKCRKCKEDRLKSEFKLLSINNHDYYCSMCRNNTKI